MIAPTHVAFAEFVYLLLLTTTGVPLSALNAGLVAVCSLLPDVDTAASTAGRLLPFLSVRIERTFGHRTLTHSAPMIAGLAVCGIPLYVLDPGAYVCCLTAYASHPFLDTMTVNGVKLFYPFASVKCVFPLEVGNPHRYRVQTGGRMDKTLAVMFLAGCIPTFLIAHQGYERFIRLTQRNIDAAVRDFGDLSKSRRVLARVSAHDMLTKEPITDTVEVVGALNAHTLVFRGADGALHTLGKPFQADYAADDVVCVGGEPVHAVVRNVDLANQFVSELAVTLDSSESYLFGDLTTADKVSLPENIRRFTPVTGAGNLVRLNYATSGDLRAFGLENAFITKGMLTVKTTVAGTGGGGGPAHKPLAYETLTFWVAADESVRFFAGRSDTVSAGTAVAERLAPASAGEQLRLNEEKSRLLRQQEQAAAADLDLGVASAARRSALDSAEHAHALELFNRGYLAAPALEATGSAYEQSKRTLAQLRSSRQVLREKAAHEVRKLGLENTRLREKIAAAERGAELRSPVRGIIQDIRRVARGGKVQYTVIMRRL